MKKPSRSQIKDFSDVSVIIPTAGLGRRMVTYGPKALLGLPDGRCLIRRQIDIIRNIFPGCDVTVVVGHEAEQVLGHLPRHIRVIENERFKETSVSRSILLGLRASVNPHALVVYGDLVFSREALSRINPRQSSILIGQHLTNDIGVTVDKGKVEHLDFGLETKHHWLNVFTLADRELPEFKRVASITANQKLLGWEILNKVIDDGGHFKSLVSKGKVLQIDSARDLKQINLVIK